MSSISRTRSHKKPVKSVAANITLKTIATKIIKQSSNLYDIIYEAIQKFRTRNYENEDRRKKDIMIELEKSLQKEFQYNLVNQSNYGEIQRNLNNNNKHTIRFLFLQYYELMDRSVGQDDNTYVPKDDPEFVYFIYDLLTSEEKEGYENEPNGDYTYRGISEQDVKKIIKKRDTEFNERQRMSGGNKTRKRRSKR